MNKLNLIRLGIFCEKKYKMADDLEIMELPDDYKYPTVRCARKIMIRFDESQKNQFAPTEYEDVELEVVGINDNFETMRVGYSYETHKLIIQERSK